MQRYMVNNKNLELEIDDKKHIINVMRMNVNDTFEIVFNKTIYLCVISSINKKDLKYEIIEQKKCNEENKVKVILACSIIKEQKMDYLLQKACELGVDEIIPIISERTVIKIDNKKDNKIQRWKKILKEAAEQSKRIDIPILHDFINIKDIKKYNFDFKFFCNTNEKSKNIKKVLQDNKKSDTMYIVVGPEGGFSFKEEKFLIDNNFESVSLGNNILRAETVPLYLLSVINYEYGR